MEDPGRRLMCLLVGLASVFIILWGINLASFLLSPILLAMMITIAVLPLTGWFRNKGLLGLTVLTVLEMFKSTRWLVVLVRASPAQEDGEREEAEGRLRRIWNDVRHRTEKLVASD